MMSRHVMVLRKNDRTFQDKHHSTTALQRRNVSADCVPGYIVCVVAIVHLRTLPDFPQAPDQAVPLLQSRPGSRMFVLFIG